MAPNIEQTLFDKYLARALDEGRQPLSRYRLTTECERNIKYGGRNAKTIVYMKGDLGQGIKKRRRLFPGSPLGNVLAGGWGGSLLTVEFPSVDLLNALNHSAHAALVTYYLENSDPRYPNEISLPIAIQLAQYIAVHVDIDSDVVESIWNKKPSILRTAHSIAIDLLVVEDESRKHRWKHVDLAKWEGAGLSWPVLNPLPKQHKPPSSVVRLTQRQLNLLRFFGQADEDGKRHIEQAALKAARNPSQH